MYLAEGIALWICQMCNVREQERMNSRLGAVHNKQQYILSQNYKYLVEPDSPQYKSMGSNGCCWYLSYTALRFQTKTETMM